MFFGKVGIRAIPESAKRRPDTAGGQGRDCARLSGRETIRQECNRSVYIGF